MIIIQRFDGSTATWVDVLVRHAFWKAYKTAIARCLCSGRDHRIISAHSGTVLQIIEASQHGHCCPLSNRPVSRADPAAITI